MSDKLFVIAIGGTGMRCLESFVHLCAIGMFDRQEIEVMMLDTDSANGNLGRTEKLIDLYRKIKSNDQQTINGGEANANTFFSAKINFYKFCTDYNKSSRSNFRNISRLKGSTSGENDPNQDLADLFLDKKTVQEFNLAHGYRAQTHLGSHLMYHGIIEAARKIRDGKKDEIGVAEKDLGQFLDKLNRSAENARVFVFGSVFGGTGASSIPIIPVAFREAIGIIYEGTKLNLEHTKFGSTLLTEYFSFKVPDKQQTSTKEDSVVANSAFFPLNSQAALQFYQEDPTVQGTYKRLYHIGWPLESSNLSKESKDKNITGGETQKNDCHFVELMCACAAFDFFTIPDSQLEGTKAQYLFRILDCSDDKCFNINSGSDLVGMEIGDIFTNKLAAFLSYAHLDLKAGTKAFLNTLKEHDVKEYNSISPEDQKNIEEYMKYFDYRFEDGVITYGWICQIKNSLGSGAFILNSKAFPNFGKKGSVDFDEDIDKLINDEKHHWDLSQGKGLLGGKDALNTLVFHMKSEQCLPKEDQSVNSVKERFFAHIYNAITVAQNFNVKAV